MVNELINYRVSEDTDYVGNVAVTTTVVKINNVDDNGLRNDVVIDGARLYPKSIWGNNGSFSFIGKNRDNIFKTLAPFLIGSSALFYNYGL